MCKEFDINMVQGLITEGLGISELVNIDNILSFGKCRDDAKLDSFHVSHRFAKYSTCIR